jgi:hypothetical protein
MAGASRRRLAPACLALRECDERVGGGERHGRNEHEGDGSEGVHGTTSGV